MNTYIGQIGLENFRGFNDRIDLKLRAITILTGPNNSGKSSVGKALRLLSENINRGDLSKINTAYIKGFSAKNVPNHKNKNGDITFFLSKWGEIHTNLRNIYPTFEDVYGNYNLFEYNESFLRPIHVHKQKSFTITYCREQESYFQLSWKTFIVEEESAKRKHVFKNFISEKRISVEWDRLDLKLDEEAFDNLLAWYQIELSQKQKRSLMRNILSQFARIDNFFYNASDENLGLEVSKDILDFPILFKSAVTNYRSSTVRSYYDNELKEEVFFEVPQSSFSKTLSQLIFELFQISPKSMPDMFSWDLQYLPNLVDKERLFSSLPTFYELKVLLTNFVFVTANRTSQSPFYEQEHNLSTFGGIVTHLAHTPSLFKTLYPFIKFWLKSFEIGDELFIDTVSSGSQLSVLRHGVKTNINDLGFGSVQLIAMLLNIAMNPQRIIVLEEPESNLHPNLQSKLADFIIDCSIKFNCQFIVETHSEYLIRKLQYWIGGKKFKSEDIIVHYFSDLGQIQSGSEQVAEITINDDGSLEGGFGSGFFDEATNIQFELLKINKQQAN